MKNVRQKYRKKEKTTKIAEFSCYNLTIVLFILFKYVSFFKIMLSDFFTEHLFAISIVSDRSDLLAVVSVVAAYFFLKKYSQTTLA